MAYKPQRENGGILFKNNRKQQENHADYRGAINVEGTEYYLNGWIKEGNSGKFLSLSIKAKNQQRPKVVGGTDYGPDPDEEIPF